MKHLLRQDRVMTELKQALSVASNNFNGGIRVLPSFPAYQTMPRIGNIALREEFGFNENKASSGGSGSRNDNNVNDLFKTKLMIFMRETNE